MHVFFTDGNSSDRILQHIEFLIDNHFALESVQHSIGTSSMGKSRGVKVRSDLSLNYVFHVISH